MVVAVKSSPSIPEPNTDLWPRVEVFRVTPPPSTHQPALLCPCLPWTQLCGVSLETGSEPGSGDGSEVLQDPERFGDFPIQHPRRPALAGEDWWGLTWGLKAASPGALFIEYLLFGCHHQREGEGQQGGEGI